MTELEPARLLDDDGAPVALRDALHALRERAPSAASAARIRERIQSPPQPAPIGRIAAASVVVLGLVGWATLSAWPEPTPPSSVSRSGAEAPLQSRAQPRPEPVRSSPAKPVAMAPSAQGAVQAAAAIERTPDPAATELVTPEPSRSERRAKAEARAPHAARVLEPTPQPARAVTETEPAAEPEALIPTPAAKPAAVDDAERMFADPQDEAGLLYRAKRLSSSDPTAALRLLVLHEASFPEGAFAEERDMLEIQIHERLGRTASAKRLAAIFKQRYPESVYRVSP